MGNILYYESFFFSQNITSIERIFKIQWIYSKYRDWWNISIQKNSTRTFFISLNPIESDRRWHHVRSERRMVQPLSIQNSWTQFPRNYLECIQLRSKQSHLFSTSSRVTWILLQTNESARVDQLRTRTAGWTLDPSWWILV